MKRMGSIIVLILGIFFRPLHCMAAQQPEIFNRLDRELDDLFKSRLFFDSRVKVKIGGQSRYRYEYRDDFNLNDNTYEDDSLHLLRNRLNMDVSYLSDTGQTPLHFFVEGQEAHSFAQSQVDKTNTFVNWLDLRQLFAEVKSPWHLAPVTLKAGRQVLSYGDERFVGPSDWTNPARVFDALKLIFNPNPQVQLDIFGSRIVKVEKEKWDQAQNGDNSYGIYLSTKPFRKYMGQILDTFLFIRDNTDRTVAGERTGEHGSLKEYTFGNRFKGKEYDFDYGTEYAVQLGSRSHDEIAAWAFHQALGYTLSKLPWTPRIYGEYNHASGDRNPTDGKSQTFDNLFPTNHNKYGFMDFLSLKNMNDFMVGTSVKPHTRLQLSSDFHWFLLDAKESAWFNAAGGTFRAPNANADTQLGEELDLLGTYKLTEHLNLMLGYSHFFAGPFAKDTGAHDDANFLYTQTVLTF
ncbi:MAG: alginate export family protein [Candidatus Omnitrophica bacterium]|nr:alginate export family protein [Candidatus Omnitrophota bacterium]